MDRPLAVVTGASSGIGAEFAAQLAAGGHDLLLVARSADALGSLADRLAAEHRIRASIRPTDLADTADLDALATELAGLPVELLVNNAGFGTFGRFDALDADRDADQVRVNVLAVTTLAHAVAPGLVARRRGGIINVSSVAAFQPTPRMTVYGATKAYVLSFSHALRIELRPAGVRVTALCPGPVRTSFFEVVGTEQAAAGQQVPVERVVAAGLRGYHRDRAVVIPGPVNRLAALGSGLMPDGWAARIAGALVGTPTPAQTGQPV